MYISKDFCTYYTLHKQMIFRVKSVETGLRVLIQSCLDFIEEETLLQTNGHKMVYHTGLIIINHTTKFHPKILLKAWSTLGDAQRIITDNCCWIIIKVRKIKKVSERKYQQTTLPQIRSICFLVVHRNISLHTNL